MYYRTKERQVLRIQWSTLLQRKHFTLRRDQCCCSRCTDEECELPSVPREAKQQQLRQFLSKQNSDCDAIRVECLFIEFLHEYNIPLTALDHVGSLLRKMHSTSDVAKAVPGRKLLQLLQRWQRMLSTVWCMVWNKTFFKLPSTTVITATSSCYHGEEVKRFLPSRPGVIAIWCMKRDAAAILASVAGYFASRFFIVVSVT